MDHDYSLRMDKVYILDFPDEILLKIFGHFDKRTLCKTKSVCRRFRNIANEVLPAKFSGKTEKDWYRMHEASAKNDTELYRPFLQNFGSIVTALHVIFRLKVSNKKNHWLIALIKQNLKNVSKLRITGQSHKSELNLNDILSSFPKLTSLSLSYFQSINSSWSLRQYPLLESIEINDVSGIKDGLNRFFSNNKQLKHCRCNGVSLRLDTFNGSSLKSLILGCEAIIDVNSMVLMGNLVELSLYCSSKLLFNVIGIGCKNIEKFTIHGFRSNISNDDVTMISSLTKLTNLTMPDTVVRANQLKKLIQQLPKLISLKVKYEGSITIDEIQLFMAETKNHSSLRTIDLNSAKVDSFLIRSLSLNFHEWFNANTKDDFTLKFSPIVITKEKITNYGKLIHWYRGFDHGDGKKFLDLKDKCLDKIISYLNFYEKLKLYQTCNRMQKMIEPFFKQKCLNENFRIPKDMFLAEKFLQHFGRFLPRIYLNSKDYPQKIIWDFIHQFCPNHLEELIIENADYPFIYYLQERGIIFPKLKKLNLKNKYDFFNRYRNHTEQGRITGRLFMFCPDLLRLEIEGTRIFDGLSMSTFVGALNHLSVIRFKCCNDTVMKFLSCLNDNTCNSLRDLSIQQVKEKVARIRYYDDDDYRRGYYDDEDVEEEEWDEDDDDDDDEVQNVERVMESTNDNMSNTITRFTNLTSLHLIFDGWFKMNLKSLFESCQSVKILSVLYEVHAPNTEKFQQIKKYGSRIERLQIVMHAEDKGKKNFKFLQSINQLFSNITVKVIEYSKDSNKPAYSFILSDITLSNWDFEAQLFG